MLEYYKDKNTYGVNVRSSTGSIVASTLAMHFLSLALPIMTLQVYDRVLPNHTTDTLELLTIGVCVAIILETLLKLSRAYIIGWTGAAFEHGLSSKLIEHALAADLKHLKRDGIGMDLQRLSAVSKIKGFYNGELVTTFLEGVLVFIFIGLIWYIAGALMLVPMVVLTIFTGLTIYLCGQLKNYLNLRNDYDASRYNFLVQTLTGVHTIKASGLEQVFRRRYEYMEQQSGLANLLVARSSTAAFNNGAVFSHLMVAAVITFGALQVIHGQISVGALVACILLSRRIMQPVQKMLQLWVKTQDFDVTEKQIQETLKTPLAARPAKSKPIRKKGRIKLDKVYFKYDDNTPWLLKNISLDVKPGETIFISGQGGAGKSTLLKLIAGIYSADKGSLIIDGHNSNSLSSAVLSQHIAYISDSSQIFRGTIRENLTRFGMVKGEQALEIANEMGIQQDIARLPSGFDTKLEGTITDSIPPGLKQKVLIARALAPRPKIVLFDGADHALDRKSYQAFRDFLKSWQPEIALIIVSDDPAMLQLAQKHYLLYDGQLVQQEEGALNPPSEDIRL